MKFALRMLGFLAVVGGFVALVIDGTRFLADGTFAPTPLGKVAFDLLRERFLLIQPAIERHLHPFLWQYLLQPLFEAPTSVVFLVLGFVLIWVARPKPQPIGHATGGRG